MTKSKYVPKRRFKEFELDSEWELLTLSDISEGFEYGLNVPAKEFDGINKYLRITDIDDTSREFLISNLSSPDANCESFGNYLLAEGDVLFARTGASTGKTYYYKETDGKVFFAGFLIRARVKGNFDHRFVFQNTLTKKYKNYIELTSQRSGQPGVNAQEYSRFSLYIPSLSEQKVIGDFVEKLDSLISLHQHKLDKLKNLKKSYLAELFPAEGERIPKRRFPGFEGEWEQDLLGNIVDFSIKTNSFSRENLTHKSYEVQNIHYGDILVKFQSVLDLKQDNLPSIIDSSVSDFRQSLLQDGDVIFADAAEDSTVGKAIEIRNIMSNNVVSGLHTIAARPRQLFAPYYLGYYLNSDTYHNQILPLMQGTKVSSISKSNLQVTEISFPKIDEQKQIGNFFKKLDQSISLQQQKLDKLNDLKKAYLNELFV